MIKAQNRIKESGNVFLVVMLGIALFTGLAFTLSRSMRSENTSRISQRETKLYAAEIIEFGSRVERAVSDVRRKGCSENELTFEDNEGFSKNSLGTPFDYTNNNAPDDFSCHIFHREGGNIQPRLPVPDKAALEPEIMNNSWMHPQSFWVGATRVEGVGSEGGNGTDLLLSVGRLSRGVCVEINNQLGLTFSGDNPPQDLYDCDDDPFDGDFPGCANSIGDSVSELEGRTAFCSDNGDSDDRGFMYHQVLLAR